MLQSLQIKIFKKSIVFLKICHISFYHLNTLDSVIEFTLKAAYNRKNISFPKYGVFYRKENHLGEKDISEKLLADYEDVFADIVNVLLFHGERRVKPDTLQTTATVSHYKADDARLHEQERNILKAWTAGRIQIALLGLEPYVNDYHIHVFEIAWLPDEQINQFQSDFRVVARYFSEKRKNKDYVPHDKTILKYVDAVLKLLAVMSGDQRYEMILADPEQKGTVKTMDDALTKVINKEIARRRSEWFSEGRIEGRSEGRSEGRIELLVSLCKAGHISVNIAAAEMHISTEEFQKYLDNDTNLENR